jgi:hypothetical protein
MEPVQLHGLINELLFSSSDKHILHIYESINFAVADLLCNAFFILISYSFYLSKLSSNSFGLLSKPTVSLAKFIVIRVSPSVAILSVLALSLSVVNTLRL